MKLAKTLQETDNPLVRSGKVRKHRDPRDGEGRASVPTLPPPVALSSIPRRMMGDHELVTLPLDHRAGFLLAHMDGETSLRTIVDICGMSQLEITELVEILLELNVIRLT